jgi:putative ABC transport system permease protein
MRSLLWRFVEWRLRRQLSAEQFVTTLGDLEEDFARRRPVVGPIRATFWLLAESRSVAAAYRRSGAAARVQPRRFRSAISFDETRLAARRLLKRPLASMASIVTLACGIGASAATYSLISSVLLRPLPVADADRLVEVDAWYMSRRGPATQIATNHAYPVFIGLRESGAFAALAAGAQEPRLVAENGQAQERNVYFASRNLFETLGVLMALGPGFSTADDRPDAALTAVVSYRYWQRVLGGDRGVIGRAITIANLQATIVGVSSERFRGLNLATAPDLYLPLERVHAPGSRDDSAFSAPVSLFGRLKPGATPASTLAQLNALPTAVRGEDTLVLTPLNTAAIPQRARAGMAQFARLLSMTVGLLLLIAGLTVGMLLLIRTEARQHEFAMCLALGASRRRLAWGVAMEGALLAVFGAAAAVPVAWGLFHGLGAFQLPGRVDVELLGLHLDVRVLVVSAGAAAAVTLVIALLAGVFGFTTRTADALRTRAGGALHPSRRRTRSILVAAQVAVTLVLLAGAGLFTRSLIAALELNPAFDPDRLVTGPIDLGSHGYTAARAATFFDDLRERLALNAAAVTSVAFMRPRFSTGAAMTIDGQPRRPPSTVAGMAVDDRYFRTVGMRVLAGRDFSAVDTPGSPLVIIVSESFGRWLASGGDPVGHRITDSRRAGQAAPIGEVIGVVSDVVTDISALEPLAIYYSTAQQPPSPNATLVVRATSDAAAAVREALHAIRAADPALPPPLMTTLQDQIGRQMRPQSFGALALGVLGGIAALLTILGAYTLAESMADMRRREMGIRAALGASRTALGRLLLWQTVRLISLGLLIGLGLAWLGASTIRAFLFQVTPFDPATLIGVSATILAMAIVVSVRPALTAMRVDLARLLREE